MSARLRRKGLRVCWPSRWGCLLTALAAGGAASQEPAPPEAGPAEAVVAALEPERLDVVQSELARQGQAVAALREVIKGLEEAAEFEGAEILLAGEGDPAERLVTALTLERARKVREAEVAAFSAPAREGEVPLPLEDVAAPAVGVEREGPLAVGVGDVLYAQAATGTRPGKVVLRLWGRPWSLTEGAMAAEAGETVKLRSVRQAAESGLAIELLVNGSPEGLTYAAGAQ